MKLLFVTGCGSRGDFTPSLCFSHGLQRAGHDVTVLTTENYRSQVEEKGLKYAHLSGDPREIMGMAEVQEALAVGDAMKAFVALGPAGKRIFEEGKVDILQAIEEHGPFDLIVTIPMGMKHIATIAEKTQIPVVYLSLVPTTPTRQFGHVAMGNGNMGDEEKNLQSYEMVMRMSADTDEYNKWRQEIGLKPLEHPFGYSGVWQSLKVPTICPFSPITIGGRPSDWGDNVQLTGYMQLKSDDDVLDASIQEFLDAGEKPIYLGFGSMPSPKPKLLVDLAIQLAERTGSRVIYSSGWTSHEDNNLPPNVLSIKEAPHHLLFPRCKSVLHHCGVGTTAAVLIAGVPQIPIPFFVDQPFWAQKVFELGVASPPIHFKDLTIDNLIESASFVSNPAIVQRASQVAQELAKEGDGLQKAIDAFEAIVNNKLVVINPENANPTSWLAQSDSEFNK